MKVNAMVNVGVLLDAILQKYPGVTVCAKSLGVSTEIINRLLDFNGERPQLDSLGRLVRGLNLTNERLFIPCPPTSRPEKAGAEQSN